MGWEPISLEVLVVPGGDAPGGSLPGTCRATIDTGVAHPARVYDYWLGGKDNYAADREAGEQALLAYPQIRGNVRSNRAFLRRAVRYLAGSQGIRQFVDIGTGLPSADNTHEVAQRVAPECRVVYVDSDPIVLSHARALLASGPAGACAYLDADLRDTGKILALAGDTLDLARPVAVMLLAVLLYVPDEDGPCEIVRRLVAAVPAGSFLVISHPSPDLAPPWAAGSMSQLNERMAAPATLRARVQVQRFLDGLELVEPGLVATSQWRPDSAVEAARSSAEWAAVARKP